MGMYKSCSAEVLILSLTATRRSRTCFDCPFSVGYSARNLLSNSVTLQRCSVSKLNFYVIYHHACKLRSHIG